jgi:hypothetical protein
MSKQSNRRVLSQRAHSKLIFPSRTLADCLAGGADRDRTDDLKLAKLALSQLSYGPQMTIGSAGWLAEPKLGKKPVLALSGFDAAAIAASQRRLVGPGRVERPTSRLSGVRSNHLSYEPETRLKARVPGSLRQDYRD